LVEYEQYLVLLRLDAPLCGEGQKARCDEVFLVAGWHDDASPEGWFRG
jgi:hypothetical protein